MKLSSEVKVGAIGIVTIVVLVWGINYLKGRNILSSSYAVHAFSTESGGLEVSSPVIMHGVKIGYVDQIVLRTAEKPPVKLILSLEKEYPIGSSSVAELFSADLLGSKAIRIVQSGENHTLGDQDTIPIRVVPDLISNLQTAFLPVLDQMGRLAVSLDTLSRRLDTLVGAEALKNTLEHLSSATGSLKSALAEGGSLDNSFRNLESLTGVLSDRKEDVASLVTHLNSISETIDSAGLGQLAGELHGVSEQFNLLLEQVNSGEGTAGKLFYSDSLYRNLEALTADLDSLVRDLNENPEDYVQISVFGRSKKKK